MSVELTHRFGIPVNSTSPPSRMAFSSVISTMFRSSFFRVSFIISVWKKATKHRGTHSLEISVQLKIDFNITISINRPIGELVWTCAEEGHLGGRMPRWECQSRAKRRFMSVVKEDMKSAGVRGGRLGWGNCAMKLKMITTSHLSERLLFQFQDRPNISVRHKSVHYQNGRDNKNQSPLHPRHVAMMSS